MSDRVEGKAEGDASHYVFETQRTNASHLNGETQGRSANHLGATEARDKIEKTSTEENAVKEGIFEAEESALPAGLRKMRERCARLKHPRLRVLVEMYYDFQKLRVATENRLRMYELLNLITPLQSAKLHSVAQDLKRDEKSILEQIEDELETILVWQWLKNIKGIGPAMAAGIISWVDDISRSPHVSSLWKYAGMHVVDGAAPKRRKGEKAEWNQSLRTHMWKVVKQLLQANNEFYRGWYDRFKQREIEKCKERGMKIVPSSQLPTKNKRKYEPEGVISVGHIDNRAKRKVAKLFLSHLWFVWRQMEGLPTDSPYAQQLGHRVVPSPNWPLRGAEAQQMSSEMLSQGKE